MSFTAEIIFPVAIPSFSGRPARCLRGIVAALLLGTAGGPVFGQNLVGAKPGKEATPVKSEKIAAIFVTNRADPKFGAATKQLEDSLSARVGNAGYAVVNRDVAVDSIAPAELDAQLSRDSSMLALARNLGANLILRATITQIVEDRADFKSANVATSNYTCALYATYQILDVARGGSIASDTVKTSFSERDLPPAEAGTLFFLPGMMNEAAEKMTASLQRKEKENPVLFKAQAAEATFAIATGIADATAVPLSVPLIEKQPDGTWLVKPGKAELQALDVAVELDGFVLGSAPGTFHAAPGLHQLKLTREGFATWTRRINVFDGQTLRVALPMSPEGYERWRQTLVFAANLKAGEKLTDAVVKDIEGHAQMLRQSGFKVDAKNLPDTNFWLVH